MYLCGNWCRQRLIKSSEYYGGRSFQGSTVRRKHQKVDKIHVFHKNAKMSLSFNYSLWFCFIYRYLFFIFWKSTPVINAIPTFTGHWNRHGYYGKQWTNFLLIYFDICIYNITAVHFLSQVGTLIDSVVQITVLLKLRNKINWKLSNIING